MKIIFSSQPKRRFYHRLDTSTQHTPSLTCDVIIVL